MESIKISSRAVKGVALNSKPIKGMVRVSCTLRPFRGECVLLFKYIQFFYTRKMAISFSNSTKFSLREIAQFRVF